MDLKQQAPAAAPSILTVSPSPHARRKMTTTSVMKDVLIALLPTTVWGIYIYGLRAALVVLLAVVSSVLFEAGTQLLLKRKVTVYDCSAAVTGLLLGLNLSPSVPLYVPIVGSAFAIILVKQLFGGIGKNVMNPALAARVFLMMAWTGQMTVFPAAYDRVGFGVDAVASATPLVALKQGVLPEAGLALRRLKVTPIKGEGSDIEQLCKAVLVFLVFFLAFKLLQHKKVCPKAEGVALLHRQDPCTRERSAVFLGYGDAGIPLAVCLDPLCDPPLGGLSLLLKVRKHLTPFTHRHSPFFFIVPQREEEEN